MELNFGKSQQCTAHSAQLSAHPVTEKNRAARSRSSISCRNTFDEQTIYLSKNVWLCECVKATTCVMKITFAKSPNWPHRRGCFPKIVSDTLPKLRRRSKSQKFLHFYFAQISANPFPPHDGLSPEKTYYRTSQCSLKQQKLFWDTPWRRPEFSELSTEK